MEPFLIEESTPARSWQVDKGVLALMLAGTATFVDVYTTQALLPFLKGIYHASELEVSLTVSATILAVAITAPFVGLFAEGIGRKRIIVPALFGLALPTFLAATSTSLHALIFWRFLQGLFIPGIIAVTMAYINEEWAGRGVGAAMAAYVAGTVFGGFLGRLIPGIITTHWNWRTAFIVLGMLNLLGGLGVWRWLPPAEKFVASSHVRESVGHFFGHLRNTRLLATFGMGSSLLFALVAEFTYVNFHLAAAPYHLNTAELGSIFFVYLLGLVITPVAGRYLDRVGFLKTATLAACLSSVGLGLTLLSSLPGIITGLALFSSGKFVLQATATSQMGKAAGRARSSAAGLYLTFYYAGGSLGAVVPAFFWRWGGWPACVALVFSATWITILFARASTE